MTQPMPRYLVSGPTLAPWRYGLASAAQIITLSGDPSELKQLARGVEYETDACYQVKEWLGDACVPPTIPRVITLTFTAAPSGGNTIVSAAATVDGGPARSVSVKVAAAAPVVVTTGAAAAPVYTQTPSAAGVLAVIITDVLTGAVLAHNVTVNLAGAVTAGGTATLDAGDIFSKSFNQDNLIIEGTAFGLYAETGCYLTGAVDTAEARARAKFAAGEQAAVERVIYRTMIIPGATDITPTPGTPVSLKTGLGLLEQYSAANYGGTPIFHAPRSLAPWAADIYYIERVQSQLHTQLDSIWAFGGGYDNLGPDGDPAPAGTVWVYATGTIVITQSQVWVPAATPEEGAANLFRNQLRVLAERSYAPTIDCLRAAVLINLEVTP